MAGGGIFAGLSSWWKFGKGLSLYLLRKAYQGKAGIATTISSLFVLFSLQKSLRK